MNKPVLIMLVGLPAAGKSTYSKKLSDKYDATIFSSDKLRVEMFGDIHNRDRNPELFTELHKRIKECLRSGKSAIYDATNINSRRRRSFLQELNKIECGKLCIIMATPYKKCLESNSCRDRHVPENVINDMYEDWSLPSYEEGWDEIAIKYYGITEPCKIEGGGANV